MRKKYNLGIGREEEIFSGDVACPDTTVEDDSQRRASFGLRKRIIKVPDVMSSLRLLLVDNSGSTMGMYEYWARVETVYNKDKFDLIYFWNDQCHLVSSLEEKPDTGGTKPQCFFDMLLNDHKKSELHLVIITDGEITDYDIEYCTMSLYDPMIKRVSSVNIYYFGHEECMNLGLNVVFGSVSNLRTAINSTADPEVIASLESINKDIEQMSLEEISDPKFSMDVISRVRFALERGDQQEELQQLRGKIIALFDKFLKCNDRDSLKKLFENDQCKEYVDIVLGTSYDDFNKELDLKKQRFLSCFDKHSSLTISHFTRYSAPQSHDMLESTKLQVDDDGDGPKIDWTVHTDEITFDDLAAAPCLLMDAKPLNIAFSNHELQHPFAMFRNDVAVKAFCSAVEPHVLGFDTIFKIDNKSSYRSTVTSPFTRQACHIIILAPKTFDHLKFNSTALSKLFGDDLKMPGNLVLWNFVSLYLIYKHKELESNDLKETLLRELRTFCETFQSLLTLSIKCLVKSGRVPLIEALWFCCRAVPMYSPNSVTNMLRLSFGLEMAQVYLELFPPKRDQEEILRRAKMWRVWNYFMEHRNDEKIALQVATQYQNYILYNDSIILLSGPCKTRFPCDILNLVDVDTVYTLFKNCNQNSKTYEAVNRFSIESPCIVDKKAPDAEPLYHVQINPKTCWPYVICKKTNKHWKECIGTFDVKQYSLVRLFHKYVHKKKAYPSHHKDLILFYFLKVAKKDALPVELVDMIEYVFGLFKTVMGTVAVDEYLSNYLKFKDEKERLKYE